MSTRRARVAALTDDVATLTGKVQALHEDLARALEDAEDVTQESEEIVQEVMVERTDDVDSARADSGNVGWQEIETAGAEGAQEAEQVAWTSVETE